MKPDVLVSVRDLVWQKSGRTILNIPQFEIRANEVTALIGPNGAGKSSLLKILAFLEQPDAGEIQFREQPVVDQHLAIRRKMAMVFQEPLLLSGSVYRNVAQGLLYRGYGKKEIEQRVHHWLDAFGIAHLVKRNQKYLSGGEAQRVSLARALAVEPEILFLDEPFAALDQPTRQSLAEDIGRVIRERQIAAVFVTHNVEELSLFTDRICVMDQGVLVQSGSPEDIFNRPANPTTARLVGVENILPGRILGPGHQADYQAIEVQSLTLQTEHRGLAAGTGVHLYIRPEAILPADGTAKINTFSGIIEKTVSLSSQYKLVVQCGFPLTILVSKGTHALQDVRPGCEIRFHLPPDKIHLVPCEEN